MIQIIVLRIKLQSYYYHNHKIPLSSPLSLSLTHNKCNVFVVVKKE
jgi:hypothetical protein